MTEALFNIVLMVASGSVSIGVVLLVRICMSMSRKLSEIDVKLGTYGVRLDHIEKDVERHEVRIVN